MWRLLPVMLLAPGLVLAAPAKNRAQHYSLGKGIEAQKPKAPVVDPDTLMCVGMKDGMSLNWRCVNECVVHAVGSVSYNGRRGTGSHTVEAYVVGGDYVCPEPKPMTPEVLDVLGADAQKVVGGICGEGNLAGVEHFSLVPTGDRAAVSATVLCKQRLAL